MSMSTDKAFNPGLTKPRVRAVFKGRCAGLLVYKRVTSTGQHIGTVHLSPDGLLVLCEVGCDLPMIECIHGRLPDWMIGVR